MKIHVVSSTESEMLRGCMRGVSAERFSSSEISFLIDEDPCTFPVMVIPNHHEWVTHKRNDNAQSATLSFINVKTLRKSLDGFVDHRFGRIYVGANLIVRMMLESEGLDAMFCPAEADEMRFCLDMIPDRQCQFALSFYVESPYTCKRESIVHIAGETTLLDEADERLSSATDRDVIGAFLSRVDWEIPEFAAARKAFIVSLSESVERCVSSARLSFN